MTHCAGRLHYQAPVPREPRDEMAELQRAFVQSVAAQAQMVAQMQALAASNAELRARNAELAEELAD